MSFDRREKEACTPIYYIPRIYSDPHSKSGKHEKIDGDRFFWWSKSVL